MNNKGVTNLINAINNTKPHIYPCDELIELFGIRIGLALGRNGINTLEELRTLRDQNPKYANYLRTFGKKAYLTVEKYFQERDV